MLTVALGLAECVRSSSRPSIFEILWMMVTTSTGYDPAISTDGVKLVEWLGVGAADFSDLAFRRTKGTRASCSECALCSRCGCSESSGTDRLPFSVNLFLGVSTFEVVTFESLSLGGSSMRSAERTPPSEFMTFCVSFWGLAMRYSTHHRLTCRVMQVPLSGLTTGAGSLIPLGTFPATSRVQNRLGDRSGLNMFAGFYLPLVATFLASKRPPQLRPQPRP